MIIARVLICGERMTEIALISSPYSKKNRKNPAGFARLKALAPDQSLVRSPETSEQMDEAMEYFKSRNVDVIAINGGDGTVHVALTSMVRVYGSDVLPKIALIKGGTMNQTATNLGIKGGPAEIFGRIIKASTEERELNCRKLILLNVDGNYGFLFGMGAVCTFMDWYFEGMGASPFSAAKVLITLMISTLFNGSMARRFFRGVEQEILADGFSFGKIAYWMTLISTIPQIGLGFELMHRARDNHESAHMVAFHSRKGVLVQVIRSWFGLSLPPDVVDDSTGKVFLIKSEEPFKYTLDGDIFASSGRLLLKTGPVVEIVTE